MQEQRKLITTLEAAETTLLRSAVTSYCQHRNCRFAPLVKNDSKKRGPLWKCYLDEKNCDHMYLSVNDWTWMSSISFIKKRVNTIHYCLEELTWLNQEIEADQRELTKLKAGQEELSKYPWMKSAFIQFNLQSATYMACQTLLISNSLHLSAQHINVFKQEMQ